ncbi:matrixin family metalloprotease [bacterium]|nr:MAG: matrixin family metalloprotease [bacterium]
MVVSTQDFKPNYADRMLSPVINENVTPGLWKLWDRFPLRVTVLETGRFFSDTRFACIKRACERWRKATATLAGGGVSFVVNHGKPLKSAQIVFELCDNHDMNQYGGYSSMEEPGRVNVQLSATRTSGDPTADWLLERVATHELGHALGIGGHSPDAADIMSTDYRSVEITRSDINTLRLVYANP